MRARLVQFSFALGAGRVRSSNVAADPTREFPTVDYDKPNPNAAPGRDEQRGGSSSSSSTSTSAAVESSSSSDHSPAPVGAKYKQDTDMGLNPHDAIERRALRQAALEFSNRKMFAKCGHACKYLNPRHDEPDEDLYLSPEGVAALALADFALEPGDHDSRADLTSGVVLSTSSRWTANAATDESERKLMAEGAGAAGTSDAAGSQRSSEKRSASADQRSGAGGYQLHHHPPDKDPLRGALESGDETGSAARLSSLLKSPGEAGGSQSIGEVRDANDDNPLTSQAQEQQRRRKLFHSVVEKARAKERLRLKDHKPRPGAVAAVEELATNYLRSVAADGDGGSPSSAQKRVLDTLVRKTLSALETHYGSDGKTSRSSSSSTSGVETSGKPRSLKARTAGEAGRVVSPGAAERAQLENDLQLLATGNHEASEEAIHRASDLVERKLQAEVDNALNSVVLDEQAQTVVASRRGGDYWDPLDREVFFNQLAEVEHVLRHLTTAQNATNVTSTTTTTTVGCIRNCCKDVRKSVKTLADEYIPLTLSEVARNTWSELSETQCESVTCDCVALSQWVDIQCMFYVGQIAQDAASYCQGAGGTTALFEKAYCPAACAPIDCNSKEGRDCMRNCGDTLGCSCSNQLGTSKAPKCIGTTEVSGESCETSPPPLSCAMHTPSVQLCAKYNFCPKNQCLIRNVVCVPDDECQGTGICIPSTGQCVYPNLAKGTPCEDNIFYTYNKTCNGMGTCVGLVNMCEQHNIQCRAGVPDCTYLPGQCQPETGRCVYEFKTDDTQCDDARPYTVGDQCQKGLCVGTIVDLCASVNCAPVPCQDEGTCHDICFGTCDKATGACIYDRKPNGVSCNDRQPDLDKRQPVCIDGVCVGDPFHGSPKYLTVGEGQCVDTLGFRMNAQQGDVGDEKECKHLCTADNQCKGYSFAFPVCTLFGTVRSTTDMDGWNMLEGDQTPALEIERVLKPGPGEPQFVCRKKAAVGDPESAGFTALSILIGWGGFSTLFGLILAFYFKESISEAIFDGRDAASRKHAQMMEKYRASRQVDPHFGEEVQLEMVQDQPAAPALEDKSAENQLAQKGKPPKRKQVVDEEGNEYSVTATEQSDEEEEDEDVDANDDGEGGENASGGSVPEKKSNPDPELVGAESTKIAPEGE
mmetsp:Transcript_13108/g.32020  ORF Transcript_13108/g.32020 Transcript_13108/m.32020 type:complete len:1155 (-) Transcript_13108:693-4157(-)